MASSTSKELLELERSNAFRESKLLVCNGAAKGSGKKTRTDSGCENPVTVPLPKSQVLGKVKDFLGVMAEANKQLEHNKQENPDQNFDIEAITGDEKEYIEMDLLLGVADLQNEEAVAAAETAVGSSRACLPGNYSSETDTECSSSNDDSDIEGDNCNTSCSKKSSSTGGSKANKPNKKPKIVVIS